MQSLHAMQQPDTPGESFAETCRHAAVVPCLARVDGRHTQPKPLTSHAKYQIQEEGTFMPQLAVPRWAVWNVEADVVAHRNYEKTPYARTVGNVSNNHCQTLVQRTQSCTSPVEECCLPFRIAADGGIGLPAVLTQQSPCAALQTASSQILHAVARGYLMAFHQNTDRL